MSAAAPALARPEAPAATISPLPDDGTRCDVCPHPVDDHDAIGLRFCRATRSTGADRACACA
jgi:hypothetical protein